MIAAKSRRSTDELDDNPVQAPNNVIARLKSQVRSWAAEDGIMSKDLNKYMLNNINNELEAMGYRAIGKL